jgi:hypothetical protein
MRARVRQDYRRLKTERSPLLRSRPVPHGQTRANPFANIVREFHRRAHLLRASTNRVESKHNRTNADYVCVCRTF